MLLFPLAYSYPLDEMPWPLPPPQAPGKGGPKRSTTELTFGASFWSPLKTMQLKSIGFSGCVVFRLSKSPLTIHSQSHCPEGNTRLRQAIFSGTIKGHGDSSGQRGLEKTGERLQVDLSKLPSSEPPSPNCGLLLPAYLSYGIIFFDN